MQSSVLVVISKAAASIQLEREKAAANLELKTAEFQAEAQLKAAQVGAKLTVPYVENAISYSLLLVDEDAANEWLQDATDKMYEAFNRSNFQQEIFELYHDLITFVKSIS